MEINTEKLCKYFSEPFRKENNGYNCPKCGYLTNHYSIINNFCARCNYSDEIVCDKFIYHPDGYWIYKLWWRT